MGDIDTGHVSELVTFHGTPFANIAKILQVGFSTAAPMNAGRMFGPGVYSSPIFSKVHVHLFCMNKSFLLVKLHSSAQADCYSRSTELAIAKTRETVHTVLACRVLIGRWQHASSKFPDANTVDTVIAYETVFKVAECSIRIYTHVYAYALSLRAGLEVPAALFQRVLSCTPKSYRRTASSSCRSSSSRTSTKMAARVRTVRSELCRNFVPRGYCGDHDCAS